MDFALDEDLEMFRKNIRKYLDKEGQTDVARAFIKGNTELVDQTIVGLAELGTTAVNISEENEGIGLGTVALVPSPIPSFSSDILTAVVPSSARPTIVNISEENEG